MATKPRSMLASIVGWIVVAALVYWFLGVVVGTIRFMVRFIVWIVLLGALLALYVKLRFDDE